MDASNTKAIHPRLQISLPPHLHYTVLCSSWIGIEVKPTAMAELKLGPGLANVESGGERAEDPRSGMHDMLMHFQPRLIRLKHSAVKTQLS
jgi:hypothetical protein